MRSDRELSSDASGLDPPVRGAVLRLAPKSDRWGVSEFDQGKAVWFEVDL